MNSTEENYRKCRPRVKRTLFPFHALLSAALIVEAADRRKGNCQTVRFRL